MAAKTVSENGKLIVLAGPSAVGKGTVAKYIIDNYPGFHLSISATTRSPRIGELEGDAYFFKTEQEFLGDVEHARMLEWATVHGKHHYGTPRGPVEKAISEGKMVLLEIDVQGAFQVKSSYPDALLIFVKPPSFEDLAARLDKRGTETPQDKLNRLATASQELLRADDFDFIVVNDQVARCAQEVVDLIKSN
jgi:guanylate kinase